MRKTIIPRTTPRASGTVSRMMGRSTAMAVVEVLGGGEEGWGEDVSVGRRETVIGSEGDVVKYKGLEMAKEEGGRENVPGGRVRGDDGGRVRGDDGTV